MRPRGFSPRQQFNALRPFHHNRHLNADRARRSADMRRLINQRTGETIEWSHDDFKDVFGIAIVPNATQRPAIPQYYLPNDSCEAMSIDSPACECWHDMGTGPFPYADPNDPGNSHLTWRTIVRGSPDKVRPYPPDDQAHDQAMMEEMQSKIDRARAGIPSRWLGKEH